MEGYRCFGCDPHSERGLRMEFYEDGDEIVSVWHPRPEFQGWVDTLHGGIQATLADEISSWVVFRKYQTSGASRCGPSCGSSGAIWSKSASESSTSGANSAPRPPASTSSSRRSGPARSSTSASAASATRRLCRADALRLVRRMEQPGGARRSPNLSARGTLLLRRSCLVRSGARFCSAVLAFFRRPEVHSCSARPGDACINLPGSADACSLPLARLPPPRSTEHENPCSRCSAAGVFPFSGGGAGSSAVGSDA